MKKQLTFDANEFKSAVRKAVTAAATNSTRVLRGVLVKRTGGLEVELIAADGYKMVSVAITCSEATNTESGFMAILSAKWLKGIIKGITEYSNDITLNFKPDGNVTASVETMENKQVKGPYPRDGDMDWLRPNPDFALCEITLLTFQVSQLTKELSSFRVAEQRKHLIFPYFEGNYIYLLIATSTGEITGQMYKLYGAEGLSNHIAGWGCSIGMAYFVDCLKSTRGDLTITYSKPEKPLQIKAPGFDCIIMPTERGKVIVDSDSIKIKAVTT